MSTFIETEQITAARDFQLPHVNTTRGHNVDVNVFIFNDINSYSRIDWIEFNIDITFNGSPIETYGYLGGNAVIYYMRENQTEYYILNGKATGGYSSDFPHLSKVVDIPDNFIAMPNDEIRLWTGDAPGTYYFTGFNRVLRKIYDFFS